MNQGELEMTIRTLFNVVFINGLLGTSLLAYPWSIALAADSAVTMPNASKSAIITPCLTSLIVSGGNGGNMNDIYFPQLASTVNGGSLCAGNYKATATCLVHTGGGCGGSSCGWSMAILDSSNNALSSSSSHNGCFASHGNICQNQNGVTVTMSNFTFSTSNNVGVFVKPGLESGGVEICKISVSP